APAGEVGRGLVRQETRLLDEGNQRVVLRSADQDHSAAEVEADVHGVVAVEQVSDLVPVELLVVVQVEALEPASEERRTLIPGQNAVAVLVVELDEGFGPRLQLVSQVRRQLGPHPAGLQAAPGEGLVL